MQLDTGEQNRTDIGVYTACDDTEFVLDIPEHVKSVELRMSEGQMTFQKLDVGMSMATI